VSRAGAEIDLGRIPLSAAAVRMVGERALDAALNGGEDFELLFAVRPTARNRALLNRLARRHDVTPIGRIIARKGMWALAPDGSCRALPARGYEHFR
jgi:thiamine-monophosphate kinase